MSYLTYAMLTEDVDFGRRSRSCIIEQANSLLSDPDAANVALAKAFLRSEPHPVTAMLQAIAAGPGFADDVDNHDGTINSGVITDQQILDQTTAMWPTVAGLYYQSDGTPIP